MVILDAHRYIILRMWMPRTLCIIHQRARSTVLWNNLSRWTRRKSKKTTMAAFGSKVCGSIKKLGWCHQLVQIAALQFWCQYMTTRGECMLIWSRLFKSDAPTPSIRRILRVKFTVSPFLRVENQSSEAVSCRCRVRVVVHAMYIMRAAIHNFDLADLRTCGSFSVPTITQGSTFDSESWKGTVKRSVRWTHKKQNVSCIANSIGSCFVSHAQISARLVDLTYLLPHFHLLLIIGAVWLRTLLKHQWCHH